MPVFFIMSSKVMKSVPLNDVVAEEGKNGFSSLLRKYNKSKESEISIVVREMKAFRL